MPEIVTIGEAMVVLHPLDPLPIDQVETLRYDIGGAEVNVAIGLARLGHAVTLISRVGDDPFGRHIVATLRREGVDTSGIIVDPDAPTGIYFREFLSDGQRRGYYYRRHSAGSRLTPADLDPQLFTQARLLHITGITAALSPSAAATMHYALECAQSAGVPVAFDPNYRAKLWDAPTARAALLPQMRRANMILLGHEDATALFATTDDEDTLTQVAALGAQIVVLKRAELGACARTNELTITVPAYPVADVIDPVGAGDGFDAGFLSAWLRGADLETALALGARIGAASVGIVGDYNGYPRL